MVKAEVELQTGEGQCTLRRASRVALLCIVVAAACIYSASPTGQDADEEYLELERESLHMPRDPSTSRLSRVRTTLKQLDNRLAHSGWLLAGARYSYQTISAATRRATV